MGFFSKLKDGLAKTREGFVQKIDSLVTGRREIDEYLYEELEEIMIQADVGVDTSVELAEKLRKAVKERKTDDPRHLRPMIKEEISKMLGRQVEPITPAAGELTVIMVVGVNGVGKTTTIGKLAHHYKAGGRKVILAAADTFRAAAIDQLEAWGQRARVDVIKQSEGSDPAAVAFDALQAARARGAGVLIVDTAGRLHTKSNLMDELKKVRRVLERAMPGAPHEVLLVLDATTGQNAISQAKLFGAATGVTGLVLTKLDGTAKGGVVIAISRELTLPVRFIGIGEGLDDLRPFDPREFAEALFGDK
ncbi:MAG: signal recognition particle-docking protein FtsY [Bacillota bacterium]|jgi:fused signal recognition particle receptor